MRNVSEQQRTVPDGMIVTKSNKVMTEAQYQQRMTNILKIAEKRKNATHCKNGHKYLPGNLYINPSTGRRQCSICKYDAEKNYTESLRRKRIALRVKTFGV